MRYAGRISDWNDEKGYGFVEPNGGGERAFVHVKEFRRGSRRPATGDLVSYLPVKDAGGRLQAREIRHSSQASARPAGASRLPRTAIGLGALGLAAVLAALGAIPVVLAGGYFAMSGLSFILYARDKGAAERKAWRTPEGHLHLVDLLGGWPGALAAQQRYRHKTAKRSFQFVFWVSVAANVAGAWWLLASGTMDGLDALVLS
jgi:uncharacterized membrane protein YsdA (DUF1294 family)/cold shock CspA family protein